ncbi:MAG: LAGLIDADG family homing endonuclease [Thaumarchaeota archaeon]|nr:LAGLIDADG family homing endonuclease [Nitrososphaerota archaeon]
MLEQDSTAGNGEELLALLRTKGLSIKELDAAKKEELRSLLDYLHNTKGLSLNDIAKLIGNKTSGYTSWLCRQLGVSRRPFEEARLKGIREKRRKYERKPFDGTDEDRAYLLGLRHGDLSVSSPWNGVVRVSTSTTHPAMAELFHTLFEPYGHVYQDPRYKKDTKSYEWNLSTIVDSSFNFLFAEFAEVKEWLSSRPSILLAYLSGFLDAEGSIITTRDNRGLVTVFVDYYNSDKVLLDWVKQSIENLGYSCSLRINKKEGVRTKKYGIIHRKDYWQLSTYGMKSVQEFARRLMPRHREKVERHKIALAVTKGELYLKYEERIQNLRSAIKAEVAQFVRKAEDEFLERHPGFTP